MATNPAWFCSKLPLSVAMSIHWGADLIPAFEAVVARLGVEQSRKVRFGREPRAPGPHAVLVDYFFQLASRRPDMVALTLSRPGTTAHPPPPGDQRGASRRAGTRARAEHHRRCPARRLRRSPSGRGAAGAWLFVACAALQVPRRRSVRKVVKTGLLSRRPPGDPLCTSV